jgi:hypothetical protein
MIETEIGNPHVPDAKAARPPASRAALQAENVRLHDAVERLRLENERLWEENHDLLATLQAHIARARSTSLFGPLELTAGTSVGPRRPAAG